MGLKQRTLSFDALSTGDNRRFGMLQMTGQRAGNMAEVKCDCGRVKWVLYGNLKNGGSRSCGCTKGLKRRSDITGMRFGTLVAIKLSQKRVGREKRLSWECRCDCGKEVVVSGNALRTGNTRSCGSNVHRADWSRVEARIVIGEKECGRCHRTLPLSSFHKSVRSHDGRYGFCKTCHTESNTERTLAERARSIWLSKRRHCLRLGIPFDLTLEFIEGGLNAGCAVTGIAFDKQRLRGPFTPSLDQIIPGLGYTKDNVQIVCLAYNVAKGTWTDADVLTMAEALVDKVRASKAAQNKLAGNARERAKIRRAK